MLTIIFPQTQMKHVILSLQSTKTKQTRSQPKVPAKLVKFVFDRRVYDHSYTSKNETRNFISTINQKKKTRSRPKLSAKLVKFVFDHHVYDHSSANTNETHNSVTTIKKTKQTISQPKVPAKFVKLVTDHVYFNQLRRNRRKKSHKLGFNDQISPHDTIC